MAAGTAAGPPATQHIGVVDLGSNTARLVVFAAERGGFFRMVDAIREPIRLAEGMGGDRRLKAPAMQRAFHALQLFADYARAARLDGIEVIATSAVRDASNQKQFLDLVAPLGLPLRVLSGDDEARYGVLAVANSINLADAWVIDLGGGSAQVSRMRDRRFESGQAFPLGAVRLAEAFLEPLSEPPSRRQVRELTDHVSAQLADWFERVRADSAPLVAVGGTARNLAAIAQRLANHPLPLLHAYRLRRGDLGAITDELLRRPLAERERMPGLNDDRADVIGACALVLRMMLERGEQPHFIVCGHGVREGAFYRHVLPEPHLIPDLRRWAIDNVFAQYPQPSEHTARVRELSLSLFDQLAPLHALGAPERELLEAAATLHDIGMTIDYYYHHRHGETLLHAAPLAGFSHREQALIGLLIRYHRKNTPDAGALAPLLKARDETRLRSLAVLLRLAEHLERSRSGRVRRVTASIGPVEVRLLLDADELPEVEMWEAGKDAELFERSFSRRLRFAWRGGERVER